MLIKVNKCEELTSKSGNKYKKVSVELEGGDKREDVAVFSSFSRYSEVKEGDVVEGVVQEKDDAKYGKSFTLADGNLGPKPAGFRGNSNAIAKAQENKSIMIAGFQESKEKGIKIASTFKASVDTAIAEYGKDGGDLEDLFKKWRKYYWDSYDYEELTPF